MRRAVQSLSAFMIVSTMNLIQAQENKSDSLKTKTDVKKDQNTSVMLNASADNGPRNVNIGLPASVGGTTILENGLPVVMDYVVQMPVRAWRSDSSFEKMDVLDVAKTAISVGDVGVSVNTYTNKGTEKLQGKGEFVTNSYGLLRGSFNVSGPMKNGFYYSVSAYANMDPGTFTSAFSQFLDKTQIYKVFINKKYNDGKGEIGVQYKFISSQAITTKQNPYYYRSNGKVDAVEGFKLGRDSYLEKSGLVHYIDPLSGEYTTRDIMKGSGGENHIFDIIGKNSLTNGMKLDYIFRYQYAESGYFNPYYSSISNPVEGKTRFRYVGSDNIYNGKVQSVLMLFTPRAPFNTYMSRVELSKKTSKHNWNIGFNEWYYHINNYNTASYSYYHEVTPNPSLLIQENYDPLTGTWTPRKGSDEFGGYNHNGAMQYYTGGENKMAVYGTEKWTPSEKIQVGGGVRLEWQNINGEWYKGEDRKLAGTNWVSGNKTKVKKDWINKTFTVNALWKIMPSFGLQGEATYGELGGKLSSYAGADDPGIKKSKIPGASLGVYFNHALVRVVSKVTYIQRSNFTNNSTFTNPKDPTDYMKKTISYDVKTIGWTTDALVTPFKNFQFHMLLTLQNPEYKNYKFEAYDVKYDYDGNIARSVSKTIIELDPSYNWKKFKFWGSARYFSKEYANYTNSLFFAGRWETFAGIDFKYNSNLSFGVSAVNLLNQSGAQGSISGTNTAIDPTPYYNKPVAGTYIRPFTLEFKTKFKF